MDEPVQLTGASLCTPRFGAAANLPRDQLLGNQGEIVLQLQLPDGHASDLVNAFISGEVVAVSLDSGQRAPANMVAWPVSSQIPALTSL
jgi:hypothetical protein